MKVAFYLNIVSPHQLPLAREVAKRVGHENFIYIYAEDFHSERAHMGWNDDLGDIHAEKMSDGNRQVLKDADIVYTGIRDLDLMESRAAAGKKTFYYSERWFKPIPIPLLTTTFNLDLYLPGWIRMFAPSYRKMARRLAKWVKDDPNARYLAAGPWAARDMRLLGVPEKKIVAWGYFVEPSKSPIEYQPGDWKDFRVLYIGRLLWLKRVDTIIRAVARLRAGVCPEVTLSIVGEGPQKGRLENLAAKLQLGNAVRFRPSVPIAQVRTIMRQHNVMVFASNALDGWGATVNEALEEGVSVIGTVETGASAALLSSDRLFKCGDHWRLAEVLEDVYRARARGVIPRGYTAVDAAEGVLSL